MNQILQNENSILQEIMENIRYASILSYQYTLTLNFYDMKLTMNPNMSTRIPTANQISRVCTIKNQRIMQGGERIKRKEKYII